MSIWIILIEMAFFAAIFTAIVFLASRGDRKYSPAAIHNYPPDIDIAHPSRPPKIDPTDIAAQIEVVIKEEDEGRGAAKTSEKKGIDPAPTADRTGDPSIDSGTESKLKKESASDHFWC